MQLRWEMGDTLIWVPPEQTPLSGSALYLGHWNRKGRQPTNTSSSQPPPWASGAQPPWGNSGPGSSSYLHTQGAGVLILLLGAVVERRVLLVTGRGDLPCVPWRVPETRESPQAKMNINGGADNRCTLRQYRRGGTSGHLQHLSQRTKVGRAILSQCEQSKYCGLFCYSWRSPGVLVLGDEQICGNNGEAAPLRVSKEGTWSLLPVRGCQGVTGSNSSCMACRKMCIGVEKPGVYLLPTLSRLLRQQDSYPIVLVGLLTFLLVPVMLIVVYGFWKKRHMGSE